MWIKFSCSEYHRYLITVYLGDVNAISGEPIVENAATRLLRLERILCGTKSLQDYVVVPKQDWLDGIADTDGTFRQFIAMPCGRGHSVETQVTGEDAAGGIQIEVTPDEDPCPHTDTIFDHSSGKLQVFVRILSGKSITLGHIHLDETCHSVKHRVQKIESIPCYQQCVMFSGRQLEDIMLMLRGGAIMPPNEMSICARGKIQQVIQEDTYNDEWRLENTNVFNVQILSSAAFKFVTGNESPSKPIDAETYAQHGLPFFSIYEEPSGITGDFGMIKSVAQIEGIKDEPVYLPVHNIGCFEKKLPATMELTNCNETMLPFRTKHYLEEKYKKYNVADF